jgi:hypothetical protein
MKIIGGTDKDKEDEARKRADALAKAIIKMLPQHLSHRELLAALSSVLAAAFAEDGTREGVLRAMRDLTASVLAEFGALKRRQRLGQRHIPEEDGDDPACKGPNPFARSRVLPVLPNAGDAERRPILHRYRVGLLCLLTFDRPPFEEAIHRHNAAALAVRIPEGR